MKVYQTSEIRNIALIGGSRSGKTTMAEAMLFHGGIINRKGSVDEKNSASDYRDIELERQGSVYATVLNSQFDGCKINIIDCPGVDDFVGEVITALRIADTALININAVNGIEVGSEIGWRWALKMEKPVAFIINQMDHEKANFEESVNEIQRIAGANATVIQYPVEEGKFDAVIDLMKMKMLKFPVDGGKPEELDIPADQMAKAEELQSILIENAAGNDESLMETYFENGTLTEEEISRGLKLGIVSRGIFPIILASAKTDQGVNRALEFIKNNFPAPNEVAPALTKEGKELSCDSADAPIAYVFKTTVEPHLGEMLMFKVYGGEITEGLDMVNPNTGTRERISQLLTIAGKNRDKIEKLVAGDIGATIKLKNTHTLNTLNTAKNQKDIVAPTQYPDPKFRTAIRAKNSSDDEKLGAILNEIKKQDMTILVEYSKELKQIILSGQGEQHINIVKWYVEKQNKIEIELFPPKIPYRETITKPAESMYRHRKQSGGAGQFGEVHMLIEPWFEGMPNQSKYPIRGTDEYPLDWGGKLVINNCIVGGAIDARFIPAILKGIMERMEEGPLTGSYARDIVVNIFDGKMHPVDSNEMAFKIAGRSAFRDAFKNAGPKILEPIYDVEVVVPADRMGDCMTDLQGRRAIVMGMDSEGEYQVIKARVPLAEMNKYSTTLSSITSGRGQYSLKFYEYQQVPTDVQSVLLKAYEAEEEDED